MGDGLPAADDSVHTPGDGDGGNANSYPVFIRQARMDDLMAIRTCNQLCLTEDFKMGHYLYLFVLWPKLLFVAEDYGGKIVGYILANIDYGDDESSKSCNGHIGSLAVLRTHRKLGLVAAKLMKAAENAMANYYEAEYVFILVSPGTFNLDKSLRYEIHGPEAEIYDDEEDEDAYLVMKKLKGKHGDGGSLSPKAARPRAPRRKDANEMVRKLKGRRQHHHNGDVSGNGSR